MLVRAPYAGHKDGLRALNNMTRRSAGNSSQAMLRVVERGRLLTLHRRSNGADPSSVGIDDTGADRRALQQAKFFCRLS